MMANGQNEYYASKDDEDGVDAVSVRIDRSRFDTYCVGDRVVVAGHYLSYLPELERCGVILAIEKTEMTTADYLYYMVGNCSKDIVIGMDFPINHTATVIESRYSKKYLSSADICRVLIIPVKDIPYKNRLYVLHNHMTLDWKSRISSKALFRCSYTTCANICEQRDMFKICQLHCFCVGHFLPWNKDSHVPEVDDDVAELYHRIDTMVKDTQLPLKSYETTSLVLSGKWHNMKLMPGVYQAQKTEQIMALACELEGLNCPMCRSRCGRLAELTPLETIQRQVFCTEIAVEDFREKAAINYAQILSKEKEIELAKSVEINKKKSISSVFKFFGKKEKKEEVDQKHLADDAKMSAGQSHYGYDHAMLIPDRNREVPKTKQNSWVSFNNILFKCSAIGAGTYTVAVQAGTCYEEIEAMSIDFKEYFNGGPIPGTTVVNNIVEAIKQEDIRLYVVSDRNDAWKGDEKADQVRGKLSNYPTHWCVPLSSTTLSAEEDGKYSVSLTALTDFVNMEVRSLSSTVSPIMSLEVLPSNFRFNASLVEKVSKLNVAYQGYRKIRGDGNCYYRSVMFGLLEQIVKTTDRKDKIVQLIQKLKIAEEYVKANIKTSAEASLVPEDLTKPNATANDPFSSGEFLMEAKDNAVVMKDIAVKGEDAIHKSFGIDDFLDAKFDGEDDTVKPAENHAAAPAIDYTSADTTDEAALDPKEPIDPFIQCLQDAADSKRWMSVEEMEADLLNETSGIDIAMIKGCKNLVVEFLLRYRDLEMNGLSIEDLFMINYPNMASLEEYCREYVLTLDCSAEGPFVDIGVLLIALGCRGLTIILDRRAENNLTFLDVDPGSVVQMEGPCAANIHLLLQPGHYDLLYPLYEDNEDGTPFFSSTQLKELCVPKRLEGNREEKMDANVSGHLAHRSIIADSYPSLDLTLLASNSSKLASVSKDMSRNDFLSQAGFLRHQSLAERISAVPRLEIRSVYPVVAKYPGSIAFLQNNNAGDNANAENGAKPLEEARFYILKGNYDELLSNSKKALNISSDRVIRFVPFNITEEKKPDITDIFDSLQDGDALHVTVEGLVRAKVISERGIAYAHIDISQYVTLEQLRDNLCQRLRLASEDYYIAEPSNIEALMKHASADVFSRTHNIDIVIDTVHKDINIEVHLKSSAETIVVTVEIPEDYESYESFCDTLAVQCGIPVGVFLSIEHKESNGKTTHISAANIKDKLEDGSSIEITICSVCASAANNGLYDVAHRDKTLLFRLSGQCGHVLCKSCMNTLVEASGKKPQKLSTEEFEEGGTSLYQYHELPVDLTDIDGTMNDILPFLKLCDITCPYPGCRTTVVAEDIQSTDKHVTDFEKALLRLRKHFEILSTYRKCSLDGILYCSDEPEPVFNLYQLDCDHFFHISCLASQLKSVLGAARRDPQPVVCPECIRTNHRCECSACDDRTDANISGAHNITDSEIKQMTLSDECPNFGPSEQALWEQVTHTYFLKTMQGYKAIVCRCGNAIVFEPREYVTEIDCPYGCNFVSCAKCEKEAHPGKTCDQAEADIAIQDVEGLMLQRCPECNARWDLNIDCLHSTCLRCKSQYCFLCTTSYTQYLNHNTQAYHRKGCSFYETHCCDEKCREQDLPRCKNAKYLPGPCENCRNGDINTHNSCTHDRGDWKACGDCLRSNVKCKHWCIDCEKKGSACDFPLDMKPDGTPYKYYSHDEVKAEEARRKSQN